MSDTAAAPTVLGDRLAAAPGRRQPVGSQRHPALPEGSRIWLGAGTEEGWAVVSVTDEGPGIADEDRPHVFERFGAATSRPHEPRRSGLGLAIVAQILADHGGVAEVAPNAWRHQCSRPTAPRRGRLRIPS
ncbi:MAG: ATP-binding protein [Acidimicrobiales bacterium]